MRQIHATPAAHADSQALTRLSLLFVHFGDEQMRGSERCLLNLIQRINPELYEVHLWCNHKALADLAAPIAASVQLGDFAPPIGFGYRSNSGSACADFTRLIGDARSLIRRAQPKVIVCNSIGPCQWMAPVSLLAGIPLLAYCHTTYLPKLRLLSLVYGASHIVGVSNFTLDNFRDDGFPARHCSAIYNGVDDLSAQSVDGKKLRKELGIGLDEFVIISLCALVEWKRVDLVIDSFRLLTECGGKPSILVVVGDGPCKERLQEQARGLRIIFCGWRVDIANLFSASDCIVVAAEREAFGLVVAEAASMQVPIVGARAGGVREIVIEGETGLLADPGSAQSFADALRHLRDNSGLRIRLGRNARLNYEKNFRVDRMTSDLISLIDTLSGRTEHYLDSKFGRFLRLVDFSLRLIVARLRGKSGPAKRGPQNESNTCGPINT